MMDCSCEIETIPGYLPLMQSDGISALSAEIGKRMLGEENVVWGQDMVGSTDLGDITHLKPAVQLMLGGFAGQQHGADFACLDIPKTCRIGAELLVNLALELLEDKAKKAEKVLSGFERRLTDNQYFKYMNGGC